MRLRGLDALAIELFGTTERFVDNGGSGSMFFLRAADYQVFREANVRLKLSATAFEPFPAIPFNSVGYGLDFCLKGKTESVEEGFRKGIDILGFPNRLEGHYTPIPWVNGIMARIFRIPDYNNFSGWGVAKKVLLERGAKLKRMQTSIGGYEGKVFYNGKIFNESL